MTLPRKAHAVVFDLDGLIFNTEPLYRDATISAARESGHDMKLEVYRSIIGLFVEATRRLLSEYFGKGFDFEVFWATASKQFYEMAGHRRSRLDRKFGRFRLSRLDCSAKLICGRRRRHGVLSAPARAASLCAPGSGRSAKALF
jgi:hypothetical protein